MVNCDDVKRIVVCYAVIAFVLIGDYQSRFIRKFIFDESMKDFTGCDLPSTANRTLPPFNPPIAIVLLS